MGESMPKGCPDGRDSSHRGRRTDTTAAEPQAQLCLGRMHSQGQSQRGVWRPCSFSGCFLASGFLSSSGAGSSFCCRPCAQGAVQYVVCAPGCAAP